MKVPEYLYLATDNARCKSAEIFVKEGDHVYMGQTVGMRDGGFFKQPIHTTCSGTVEGYEEHFHRSGKKVKFLRIHNDFKDEWDPSLKPRTDEEVYALTRSEIADILERHALVGLGGSSFPTYVKFKTDAKINTILINAVECEPYLYSDKRLLSEDVEKVIKGITYLQSAFNCHDARICIKRHHGWLIRQTRAYLERFPDSGITVCPVGNFYPQGWEIAMIKSATGIDVPSGHLPSEYGIINFNVSTVAGLYNSVKYNHPVIERYVSVTGDGIKHPGNFSIRNGTPMKYILEKCGGYTHPEKKKVFILGGPMMGASLTSDDCICTKTVTSIIVLNHDEIEEENCIRCGSCVLSCPVHLKPVQIMNAVKAMDKDMIKALEPLKCIECGLCAYSCTSKIQVTDYVRRAKVIAKL